MKTKNIFRMLLVAAALLMGANNVKAAYEYQKETFANLTSSSTIRVNCSNINDNYWQITFATLNDQTPDFDDWKGGTDWGSAWYYTKSNHANYLINNSYFDLKCNQNTVNKLKNNGLKIDTQGLTVISIAIDGSSASGGGGSTSTTDEPVWTGSVWSGKWAENGSRVFLDNGTFSSLKCDGTDIIRVYGTLGDLDVDDWGNAWFIQMLGGNWQPQGGWDCLNQSSNTKDDFIGYVDFEVTSDVASILKNNTNSNDGKCAILQGHNITFTSIVVNPSSATTSYTVTAAATTNGSIDYDATNTSRLAGSTYTFSVTPNANYEIDNVWITDVSGNTISNAQLTQGETTNGATAYTFVVPTQNVVIHATFKVAQQSSLHVGENVVWQGNFNHESYSVGQLVSTDLFKLAHAGDKVRIYGTFSDGWATEFMYDNNGWQLFNITEWGSESKAQSSTLFNYSDAGTYLEFTLTQEHLDIINNNNIQNCVIHGVNFHSTKLVIYVAPTYTINYTISGTSHGGFVSNNPASAKVGASVTFGIAVDEGYNAEVYATYGDNNTVLPLTPGANGQYSFTMPEGNVTVTLSFTEIVTIEATINGTYGAITFSCEVPVVIPSGITAYYAKQVTNSTVELLPITGGIIPAETGVVLFGDAGTYTFTEASSAGTAVTDNLLQPVLEDGGYRSNSAHEYVLTWHDHLVFAQTGTTAADLAKRQAYLAWNGAAGSRLRISIVGEGTGISTIEAESIDDDVIYNLRGQRVEHPTKGIYIIGGKKVVIK